MLAPRRNVTVAHAAAHDLVDAGQALRSLVEGDATLLASADPPWDGLVGFDTAYRGAATALLQEWGRTATELLSLGAAAASSAGSWDSDEPAVPAMAAAR